MKEERMKKRKGMKKGSLICLHLLQHISIVTAAILLVLLFLGSYMSVESRKETIDYYVNESDRGKEFKDSELFNQLLGNSVSDIICFGAIRGQMETDTSFNSKKIIDVTAFANRYSGVQSEYITASYYLDDLIKWAQNGFSYENVSMTGEEADKFLSRFSTVTVVNMESGIYQGGTVSYMNSDLEEYVTVKDVSGNLLDNGGYEREDTQATIMNNRYHTIDGKNIEDYVSTWGDYYALCQNVRKAAEDLEINYNEYLNYEDYYNGDKSNVVYYIRKTIGDQVTVYTNDESCQINDLGTLKKNLKEKCEKYIYYNPSKIEYETNTLIEEETLRYILNGYEYSYPENTQVLIGVNLDYPVQDCFAQGNSNFQNYTPYYWKYLAGAIALILMYFILMFVLTAKEGLITKKDSGETAIGLHYEDRIPTEIMLGAAWLAGAGALFLVEFAGNRIGGITEQYLCILFTGCMILLISLLFSFFYYSFVRRIKAKTIWKNSLLKLICCHVKKWTLYLFDHSSILLQVWVPFTAFVMMHIVLLYLTFRYRSIFILLLLGIDIAIGVILYLSAQARGRILQGIEKISKGDTDFKVNEDGIHGDELLLAKAVNNIGESVKEAVETSMKDERLKADLITNVSHDIKTPLTSIINYVDLIKREQIDNEKIQEYVKILDEKSQRLKQLTDDLVEASKISSGNIVLQWEKINLTELLNQTIGEFSEKFSQKALTSVFTAPKESICIEADSRRMWRIMENLFNNIYKYALQGTRIYIEISEPVVLESKKYVSLSVKNISEKPLKVNPEELTERFIRGDESRTTEGSGLGLSIAKNLTEIQNGKLDIIMDGDLFKVVLTFPLKEQN